MIIELLLNAIYKLFEILTTAINLPNLPDNVTSFINEALTYINAGVGILANYTDIKYLLVLFGVIVSIDIGIGIYNLVMWVIRKIPMANIS